MRYSKIFAIVVVVLALVVRLLAIYPGYPSHHPDEPFVYDRAADMVIRRSFDPQKFYFYQMLPMYFHRVVYGGVFVPLTLLQNLLLRPNIIWSNMPHFDTYVHKSIIQPNALYWGRLVVAVLGVLSIIVTYMLAKELYDEYTALVATLLLTFNYRHFLSSVLSLNDIPNALATLLTMLLLVRQCKSPTRGRLAMIGLLMGTVFSVKFQPFIFVPIVATLLVAALLQKTKKTSDKVKIFAKEFLFVFFTGTLIIVLVNILALFHWNEFPNWLSDVGIRNTVGQMSFRLYPYWFLYTIGIGPIVSLLAILGLVGTLVNQTLRKPTIIVLSYFAWVFFFLSYYSSGGMFVRYFVPVIPLILLFASYAIGTVARYIAKRIPIPVIVLLIILTIAANYQFMANTVISAYYYRRPPSLSCASNWVMSFLPEKSKVGIFPPAPMDTLNSKKTDWVYFDQKTDFTLPELQEKNIQYVIINLSKYSTYFIRWVMQGARYWDMPTTVFDNMLPGLVMRELENWIVYQCVKPWQAPDDNIVVVRIPPKSAPAAGEGVAPLKKIQLKNVSAWNMFPANSRQLGYVLSTVESCRSNACVQVDTTKAGPYDFVSSYANYGTPLFFPPRIESPQIPIEPGTAYQFSAWVKPEKPISVDRRDGFFRMDFYTSSEDYSQRKSSSVFVSQRVMGGDWQQVMLEGIAPPNGKFLAVSFQTEYFLAAYRIDTIDLYQTERRVKDIPLIRDVHIDRRVLYPSFIL